MLKVNLGATICTGSRKQLHIHYSADIEKKSII